LNARRYIECRGVPDTYGDLMKQIQQYEGKGGAKEIDDIVIKIEIPINYVDNQKLDGIEETLKNLSSLMAQSVGSQVTLQGNTQK